MTSVFDLPEHNNHRGVLASVLNVDYEDPTVEEHFTGGDIHHYSVKGQSYYVAHASKGLMCDTLHSYNSNLWSILAEDITAPYVRFTDSKVAEQLQRIAPANFKLLAVNQKGHRVLFRNDTGHLVVWAYTAHVPEDMSTYYLKGCATGTIHDAKRLFSDKHHFKGTDKTPYCE
tara:strand:+ start:152 stop:670 length:519 start_codon:yes stop_codon:yes gene_type:complete